MSALGMFVGPAATYAAGILILSFSPLINPQPPRPHDLPESIRQLQRAGRFADSIAALRPLLAEHPDNPALNGALASALTRTGALEQAQACYRRMTALGSASADIWFNYGNLLQRLGQGADAEAAYRNAGDLHQALVNLGNLQRDQKRYDEAEQTYRRAIAANADETLAHANLGAMLVRRQRFEEGARLLGRALKQGPGRAQWWNLYAYALRQTGHAEPARRAWHRAIAIDPQSWEAHNNLGVLCRMMRRLDEAIAHLKRAHELAPNDPVTEANLSHALLNLGQLSQADDHARSILRRFPEHPDGWLMHGFALAQQARADDAVEAFIRAHALSSPPSNAMLSNALFASMYSDQRSAADIVTLHRELAARIRPPAMQTTTGECTVTATLPAHSRDRDAQRRLRVGFVSADLRRHPVATFFEPVLEQLDRDRIETLCYFTGEEGDAVTARLRQQAQHWRDCAGHSDAQLLDRIRADAPDILIDLAGHTACNRLAVFRARPAPVQATWIGYPGTTGLPEMDWLIADDMLCPPGSDALYSERVYRLPGTAWRYRAPADAPDVAPAPMLRNGFITFGSYNNLPKLSDRTLRLWACALQAVPGARLRLKALAFADQTTREATRERFAAFGLSPDHLQIEPPSPPDQFLGSYADIDIALDPLPYNGGTTSCEALWMGVPVVTLAGASFCARMTASFASSIGLGELIAGNEQDYVAIARRLANHGDRLATLRGGLRESMRHSPLCDTAGGARALERACRHFWTKWLIASA